VILALTAVLIVAPGAWGSIFPGTPLTIEGRVAVALLFILAWLCVVVPPRRTLPWMVPLVFAALACVKLIAAAPSVPSGWRGVYRVHASDAPPAVFFSRFRREPFRVDSQVVYQGAGFGLHFLNDFAKYGTHFSGEPREVEFPLFVTWTAYARVSTPTSFEIGTAARGRLQVHVDGRAVVDHVDAPGSTFIRTATLPVGTHEIVVRYEKAAHVVPSVWVRIFDTEGQPPRLVPWSRPGEQRSSLYSSVTTLCVMLGLVLMVAATVWAYEPLRRGTRAEWRELVALGAMLAVLGLLVSLTLNSVVSLKQDAVFLSSGNDWLAYEGGARDILHNGMLMSLGSPVGQGTPYYFYPLYPYLLAMAHLVVGEDFGAVVMLNGLAVASLAPLFWLLGWRALPWYAVLLGYTALAALAVRHFVGYTLAALTDSVFAALVFVALVACRRAIEQPRGRRWLLAGVTVAVASATRPSFLMFLSFLAAAVALFWRQAPLRTRGVAFAFVCAGFALGVLPFTLRNYVVSGRFVMLVSSWLQLPYFLVAPGQPITFSLFDANGQPLSLLGSTTLAFRLFLADPVGVLWLETRKLLFTLGATWPPIGLPGVHSGHWDLVALPPLFALAMVLRRLPASLMIVLGAYTLSHIAAMLAAAPWTYGYKSILPLHAASLFGAAYLFGSTRSDQQVEKGSRQVTPSTE
jgi:hypothetical protein